MPKTENKYANIPMASGSLK